MVVIDTNFLKHCILGSFSGAEAT